MNAPDIEQLERLCKQFRIDIINTLHERQTGHPGGSLLLVGGLTAL